MKTDKMSVRKVILFIINVKSQENTIKRKKNMNILYLYISTCIVTNIAYLSLLKVDKLTNQELKN